MPKTSNNNNIDSESDPILERRRRANRAFRVDITIGYLTVIAIAFFGGFLIYKFVQNTREQVRLAKEEANAALQKSRTTHINHTARMPLPENDVPTANEIRRDMPAARIESEQTNRDRQPAQEPPAPSIVELPEVRQPSDKAGPEESGRPLPDTKKSPAPSEPSHDSASRRALANDPDVLSAQKLLSNPSPIVRLNAVRNIPKKPNPEKYAGVLCNALLDADPRVKSSALVAIEKVRPDLYQPLVLLMVDAEQSNQIRGCQQLHKLGPKAQPTMSLLLMLLKKDFDKSTLKIKTTDGSAKTADLTPIQTLLIDTINEIEPENPKLMMLYQETATQWCLNGKDCTMITGPIFAWADQDPARRKSLFPFLKVAITSKQTHYLFRLNCIYKVAEYGKEAKEFLPILMPMKLSNNESIRTAASDAISKIQQ